MGRESEKEEKIVAVMGRRRKHTGGGEVECVNIQEHCIKCSCAALRLRGVRQQYIHVPTEGQREGAE